MKINKFKTKSWIEISKKSIYSNIDLIKSILSKDTKLAAVIKANAYGHDIGLVSKLIASKVDLFAVDSIYEAMVIKKSVTNKKIIVLGYTPLKDIKIAINNNISFVCYNSETFDSIIKLNLKKIANVHIKIETGTNRQGVNKEKAIELAKKIIKHKEIIHIEGIYTHFANIEDTLNPDFAIKQLNEFESTIKLFKKHINQEIDFYHCAASSAAILYPSTHFNLIRLGIGLYGLWPSREVKIANAKSRKVLKLKPVLSWKSIVAQIKYVNKGDTVSYGRTWTATKKTKIAVIPVGYYDGFDRKLSNLGRVIIKGEYAQVIGRIAMNMFMVDITNIKNVNLEDEVTIIGKNGKNTITADEIAEKLGTINYEFVSRINPFIPRIII